MDVDTMMALASRYREERQRVFDWDKAARLIVDNNPLIAVAGLSGDMDYTSGLIYDDGEIIQTDHTYLCSTWATPVLVLDGVEMDCWCYKDDSRFNAHTVWPASAVEALKNGGMVE